ncbi:MAG: hypothetical protein EOO16_09700 [Chitinophagaceae bacterium]|nr:MAG: hypothetical protein EOO16_09700 [Chitinophagaceae bacterium]
MISYPLHYTLNDGTRVEVNPVLDGEAFMFSLDKPDAEPESFVWAPPGTKSSHMNYESALSANEMEALQNFLKQQRS